MEGVLLDIPELVSVSFPDSAFDLNSGAHIRQAPCAEPESARASAKSKGGAFHEAELTTPDGDAPYTRDKCPTSTPAPSTPTTSTEVPRLSAPPKANCQRKSKASRVNRVCKHPIQKVLRHLKKTVYRSGKWVDWPATNNTGAVSSVASYSNKVVDEARSVLDPAYKKSPNDRVFSDRYSKPNIAVLAMDDADREEKGSWADIYGFGELMSHAEVYSEEIENRNAEYALLSYHSQEDRRFVVSFCLFDDNMELYIFNRSGIQVSRRFNVHSAPSNFLRVILGFLVAAESYIGFDPSFFTDTRPSEPDMSDPATPSSSDAGPSETSSVSTSKVTETGPSLSLAGSPSAEPKKPLTRAAAKHLCVMMNGKCYRILETIHVDPVICGRGTVCFMVQGDGHDYVSVLKDSWIERSRPLKESEVLKDIRSIERVSKFVEHEIVHFRVDGQIIMDTTDNDLLDKGKAVIMDHHRLFTPYGKGLEDFDSLAELVSAFRNYVLVIKALNKKKIVHRDISPRNLILVKTKDLLLRKGVVIDFDCAIKQPRKECAKKERSGTLPFMSIDVLMGRIQEHCYYHDLESLLYVLIWICTTQGGPHDAFRTATDRVSNVAGIGIWCAIAPGPFDPSAMNFICLVKSAMMECENLFEKNIISCLHVYFDPLSGLMKKWRQILFPAIPDEVLLAALGGIIPEPCKRPVDREEANVFSDLFEAIDCTLIELRSRDSTSPPPMDVCASAEIKDVLPSSLQAADQRSLLASTTVNKAPVPNKADVFPVALQATKTDHKPRTQNFDKKRPRSPSCEQILDYISSHSSISSKRLRRSSTGSSA
ncbi:hypothetical protein DFH11DRAFT_178864 [Phellopilus nigrolimitatus]|nr:hypothetical protein DFH11DRAFT_178864 [Phellopilus nigrolimitatus]